MPSIENSASVPTPQQAGSTSTSSKDMTEAATPPAIIPSTPNPSDSPKFQISNLFVSPRTNVTGLTNDTSSTAVRRTAGGWRSQWAPSGNKAGSSSGSVEGQSSSRRGSEWNSGDGEAGENRRLSVSGGGGTSSALAAPPLDTNRENLSPWEQTIGSSLTTPPGAINELPSFGSVNSPNLTSKDEDIPWSNATKVAGNYDWANFVYAYARGRWDPVRSPHPPGQSTIVPGAKTQIGLEKEPIVKAIETSEPSEGPSSMRRPSLTYSMANIAMIADSSSTTTATTEGCIDPSKLIHPATCSPAATQDNAAAINSSFLIRERSQTVEPSIVQASDSSHSPHNNAKSSHSGENLMQFRDPFSILQLASNSAPDVSQSLAMGQSAQRAIEESANTVGLGGSKTDSMVTTKASLSRKSSDKDNVKRPHDDSIWHSPKGYTDQGLSRHAGLLPYVAADAKASTSKETRSGLSPHMSELVLPSSPSDKAKRIAHDTDKYVPPSSNLEGRRDSIQRPRPTPVQHPGLPLQPEDPEDWRLVTWSSAPDASGSASNYSTSVRSSHGKIATIDDLGTVAGLRRAARRTSIKWTDGSSRDSHRDQRIPSIGHSRSFPLAAPSTESNIKEVPSLESLQKKEQEDQERSQSITSTEITIRAEDDTGGHLYVDPILTESSSGRLSSKAGRSRTNSTGGLAAQIPPKLSAIGPSKSATNLTTYVNVGKKVETFYRDNGYLPAIIPPDELNRRQALRRYGPPRIHGDTNFDRIAHLVKLVFNPKIVLISLVGEKTQFFQTELGVAATGFTSEWLQEIAQSRDCSFCSHAILQQNDEALVVLDAEKDWRFAGNPLVKGAPNIRFYAGSPLRTADGYNLGSLCIIDDRPWLEFNPRQRHTLKEFSRVVMREMELARDLIHLRIRDRMQHSIETFTRECLEMESSAGESESQKDEEVPGLHKLYDYAAKGMREALSASGAIIFDLSHFELVVSAPQSHDSDGSSKIFFPSPYQYPDITPFANFENPEVLEGINPSMDASGKLLHDNAKLEDKNVPPMAVLGANELYTAPEDRDRPVPLAHYLKVAEFLRKYRTGHYFPFSPAPFRHLLPAGMSNILLVPIFGLNKQPFALLCAYSKPNEEATTLEDIKEPGLQYMRAMGTIILSAILKKDIMLADKAKSHFISNISHELRTPLHGILAAAELLAETKLNTTQGSYLETVEACGKSLLELVNHVLDFTKLSGTARGNQSQLKPTQRCDLIKLVQEVCESSWIGQMAKKLESQQNDGIGSAYAKGSESSSPSDLNEHSNLQAEKQKILAQFSHVETVIDVSFRPTGWLVKCDAGGIRRVLMNLIGNSLKFTTAGFVHVSLREIQSTDSHVVVELSVTDTGKGISRTFLEEQLFHPFTQENHLGPGTGLGLSIVNSIVQSPAINGKIDVWSTVGQGTEIRVTCELELLKKIEIESSSYKPNLNVEGKLSISLIGFQENLRGQSDLKEVLRTYYEDWWKFQIDEGTDGDIILVNDDVDYLEEIGNERKARGKPLPPFIVLTGARGDAKIAGACDDYQKQGGTARLLFKPAGPTRLEIVTQYCLQSLELQKEGKALGLVDVDHLTPQGLSKEDSQKVENYFDSIKAATTPQPDEAITPRAHPTTESMTQKRDASTSSRPNQLNESLQQRQRPHLNQDLRRISHHISPGPPSSDTSSLLRRHSSEDRIAKGTIRRSGQESPQIAIDKTNSQSRPTMPSRSITYHEPRLQRRVLMSPLRSPSYGKRNGEERSDYFGSVLSSVNGASNSSSSSSSSPNVGNHASNTSTSSKNSHFANNTSGTVPDIASPSSPGSVISLEGGEGAVLKTAIHNAGLLRGGTTKKRLRVLSVEDNSINRKVLAAFFGKMEVDFVEACNGQEGVEVFESHPPNHFDVIFMDLSMPVLDGLGATTQIRKIEAERFRSNQGNFATSQQYQSWKKATSNTIVLSTPGGSRPSAQARAKIFALTGRSSDEDKRRAFATGADGFIVKPLSFKVLSSLLNSVSALK